MKQVEFVTDIYGGVNINLPNKTITTGLTKLNDLFLNELGPRIRKKYIDGCNIFNLTDKQIEIIKSYCSTNKTK